MNSAGNDIVALELVNIQRSADRRFYAKIVTDREISLYQQPGISDTGFAVFVWICWAVKEAAYKFLKRCDHTLSFAPVRFGVENIRKVHYAEGFYFHEGYPATKKNYYTGMIAAHGKRLPFCVVTDEQMIAAACGETFFTAIHEIGSGCSEDQSLFVREVCLEKMRELYPESDLRIEKHDAGYPMIVCGNEELLPVSFAHHGRYVGYSHPGFAADSQITGGLSAKHAIHL